MEVRSDNFYRSFFVGLMSVCLENEEKFLEMVENV
jgi:hypothetical protein